MIDDDHLDKFNEKFRIKSSRLEGWNYKSSWWYFVTICTLNHNNFLGQIADKKVWLSDSGIILKNNIDNIENEFKNIFLGEYVIMPNHFHLLLKIKYQCIPFLCRDGINAVSSEKYGLHYGVKNSRILGQRDGIYAVSNENGPYGIIGKINPMTENGLPTIVRWLKAKTTFQIRKELNIFFGWQARYYDEIIKNEKQYFATKKYIQNNVAEWKNDNYFA